MPIEHDALRQLIRTAEPAMDSDAARVAMGLETRVLARIRQATQSEGSLSHWANAFLGGALVSTAVVVTIAAWLWFGTDLSSGVFPALVEEVSWPSTGAMWP